MYDAKSEAERRPMPVCGYDGLRTIGRGLPPATRRLASGPLRIADAGRRHPDLRGNPRTGCPTWPGIAREATIAYSDGTAVSWRVAPETAWKRLGRGDRKPGEDAVYCLPAKFAAEFQTAAAGHRVLAPAGRQVADYFKRLYVAAGRDLAVTVEDLDAVLRDEGAWFGLRDAVARKVASIAHNWGTVAGAQVAANCLQEAVGMGRQHGNGDARPT